LLKFRRKTADVANLIVGELDSLLDRVLDWIDLNDFHVRESEGHDSDKGD
jgi:hypothetical protein